MNLHILLEEVESRTRSELLKEGGKETGKVPTALCKRMRKQRVDQIMDMITSYTLA